MKNERTLAEVFKQQQKSFNLLIFINREIQTTTVQTIPNIPYLQGEIKTKRILNSF